MAASCVVLMMINIVFLALKDKAGDALYFYYCYCPSLNTFQRVALSPLAAANDINL